MKAIWLTKSSLIWYAVTLGSLAIVVGSLIALIRGVQARRSWQIILVSGLNLLAGFLLLLVLMDCARAVRLPDGTGSPLPGVPDRALRSALGIVRHPGRFFRSDPSPASVG